MKWFNCIGFFLCIISSCTGERDCPAAEDIYPCQCTMVFSNARLICENIVDADILRRVFANSARHIFVTVHIRNSILNYIPHEIFSHVEIESLEVNNVTLTDVFDAPPLSLQKLTHFSLTRVKVLRGVIWQLLEPLKDLKYLYITDVSLKTIKKDFSQYASESIRQVIFHRTETRSIKSGAFHKLINLQRFFLNEANLREFRRDIFPSPLDSLITMHLEKNSMLSLPDGIFTDMPRLSDIHLESNNLTTINRAWFADRYVYAITMDLKENPIQCDCRIKWTLDEKRKGFYGICAGPERLKGRSLPSLTENDFHC